MVQVIIAQFLSPNSQWLALACSDGTLRLWDVEERKEHYNLKGHTGSLNSVAFSPDGQRVAAGGRDGAVKIWDVASGPELPTSPCRHGKSLSGETQERRMLHNPGGGTVSLWEVPTRSGEPDESREDDWG